MARKAYKKYKRAAATPRANPKRTYELRVKAATKMLTKQFDMKDKQAARLVSLFIQPPRAMGSGRPGERYYT